MRLHSRVQPIACWHLRHLRGGVCRTGVSPVSTCWRGGGVSRRLCRSNIPTLGHLQDEPARHLLPLVHLYGRDLRNTRRAVRLPRKPLRVRVRRLRLGLLDHPGDMRRVPPD